MRLYCRFSLGPVLQGKPYSIAWPLSLQDTLGSFKRYSRKSSTQRVLSFTNDCLLVYRRASTNPYTSLINLKSLHCLCRQSSQKKGAEAPLFLAVPVSGLLSFATCQGKTGQGEAEQCKGFRLRDLALGCLKGQIVKARICKRSAG